VSRPTAESDAALAASLLAVDPTGLGGAVLRAPPGPARDAWIALFTGLLAAGTVTRRLPPTADDEALFGGLDLAATLVAGRPVHRPGLLAAAEGGVLVLPMAERASRHLAARLRRGQETHRLCLLALDESAAEDEAPPAALLDRLAFTPALDRPPPLGLHDAATLRAARARLPAILASEAQIETLLLAAAACGIASLRAPALALRALRAAAALAGREQPDEQDVATAIRLVLAPRALHLPQPQPEEATPPPPEPEEQPQEESGQPDQAPPEDILRDAAAAKLPAQLLASLALGGIRRREAQAGRSGAQQASPLRGRPIGVRAGDPRRGRLALLDTLRAAAPWQKLRAPPRHSRLAIRRDDFRIRRFRLHRESTAIFLLDASGSTALHRLAEAKGAVELLLAECYARRDRVAVLAFRGRGAEVLLPATHALARAKRALAGLPGGGASPLAAGLDAARGCAETEQRAGRSPLVVILTDGRANVARDGRTGRGPAEEDALASARQLRQLGCPVLVVDTGPRPAPFSAALAMETGGRCLPLPQAQSATLAGAVRAHLPP
jgi:magnesium chelatase subunit D